MSGIHDRLMARASKGRMPITGGFELLPLCNLSCRMCYVRQDAAQVRADGGLKPPDFWLSIAEQARDEGCMFPLITGGEPFLYPDFRELYTAIQRMGMRVSINSNGTMIDEKAVDWLVQAPPTRINITLYGGSRETYGRLCGNPDAFDRVLRAADLLTEAGLRFRFNCSLTPNNAADMEKMFELAGSYGMSLRIGTYMFPPLRRTGESGDFTERFTADEAAYYTAKADFLQLPPERFRSVAANMMKYREPTEEQLRQAEAGPADEMHCMAGRCSFWVDWKGNLSVCGINAVPNVSLQEHRFSEAWRMLVDHTNAFRFSPACSNCINRGICFFCAASVYNETGGFNGRPTYLCEKAKYSAKWYRYFLEQLPEENEISPAEETEHECLIDEFV